jgi:phage shock protein C
MKKLKRSRTNRYIMGVCGGLGEYLNIDPTIIRLVWFVLGITSFGTFALAYLVCGLVIPENDGFIEADSESASGNDNGKLFVGLALVVVGALMLGKIVFPWFSYTLGRIVEFWPALLIILGLYIILGRKNN